LVFSAQSICSGASPSILTGSNPGGGTGIYSYQWESGTSSSEFSSINGATSPTFAPGNMSAEAWFRRKVLSGACFLNSDPIKISISPSGYWTGAISREWNDPNNWCGGIPNGSDVIISQTTINSPLLPKTSASVGNLTIEPGALLTLQLNSYLTIKGNFINKGSFVDLGGTIEFSGDNTSKEIANLSTIKNIIINTPGRVELKSNLSVIGALTLTKGSFKTNGYFTLNLDSGAIAGGGTGNIIGNVNVAKNIPFRGYHYISSPLKAATFADWNDDVTLASNNYFFYDETNKSELNSEGWTAIPSVSSPISLMNGYAVFFSKPSTSIDMTGTYTHGVDPQNINITRSYTGPNGSDGWNLVGNPFPSPIDWNASSGWTRANVYDAIYYWDAQHKRYASYISSNNASTNGGSQYIPAMQAFWVRVDTNGTDDKTIPFGMTSAVRVTKGSDNRSVWREEAENNVLKLTVSNGKNNDETILRLVDQSTHEFDGKLDAFKMMNDASVPSFYSLSHNTRYSINSIPKDYKNSTIPLVLKVGEIGEYTISAASLATFERGVDVILVDSLLGKHIDLQVDPLYKFQMEAKDSQKRFYLNVKYDQLITDTEMKSVNNVHISSFEKTVNVNFINGEFGHATIVIADSKGEILSNEIFNTNQALYTKNASNLPAGMYIVRVLSGNQVKTQKVIF
ncbi:MAG TPA: T9SS type A sorting domain-containing protein, partial [Cytophagaceae bacterium]